MNTDNQYPDYPYYKQLIKERDDYYNELDEFKIPLEVLFHPSEDKLQRTSDMMELLNYYCVFPDSDLLEKLVTFKVKKHTLMWMIDVHKIIQEIEKLNSIEGIIIPDKNILLIQIVTHIQIKMMNQLQLDWGIVSELKENSTIIFNRLNNFIRTIKGSEVKLTKALVRSVMFGNKIYGLIDKKIGRDDEEINSSLDERTKVDFGDQLYVACIVTILFHLMNQDIPIDKACGMLRKMHNGNTSVIMHHLAIGHVEFISQRQYFITLYPLIKLIYPDKKLLDKDEFYDTKNHKKHSDHLGYEQHMMTVVKNVLGLG